MALRLLYGVLAALVLAFSVPGLAAPPPGDGRGTEPVRQEIDGTAKGGLDTALRRQKVPADIRQAVMSGFRLDPDFPTQLPSDARFKLIFETVPSAESGKPGRHLLRSIWVIEGGRIHDLYRYGWRGSTPVFINQNGRSLRELDLMLPVDDARVTSKFGWREHPLLKVRKFHYGLDLAAPPGTPVRAAADGVVVTAGWHGSYGKYVRIEHAAHIETGYAHLSAIASTARTGAQVKQGDLIGFVGMTGLATGPHLCFQVLEDGKQLNPLTAHPMIEEDMMQQLATNPGTVIPIQRVTDLQP